MIETNTGSGKNAGLMPADSSEHFRSTEANDVSAYPNFFMARTAPSAASTLPTF